MRIDDVTNTDSPQTSRATVRLMPDSFMMPEHL
jgi:hypothetical protein